MAETNDNISRLGLDIGPYIDALQEAVKGYQEFAKVISKTLSIRLDPTSIKNLSQALGVQMRQATTLIKGANKESVEDSIKAAQAISAQYGKVAGTGEAAFKRVQKEAKKTAEEMASMAMRMGEAGRSAGKQFAEGMQAGTEKSVKDMGWAKGQWDRAVRDHQRLLKEVAKGDLSIGPGASQRLMERLGPDVALTPTRTHAETGKVMVDADRMRERIFAIRDAYRDMERAAQGTAGAMAMATRYGTTFGRGEVGPAPNGPTSGEARLMAAIERAMTQPLSKARREALEDTARLMRNGQVVATAQRVWNGNRPAIYPQQMPFGADLGPGYTVVGGRRQNYNFDVRPPLGYPVGGVDIGRRQQNYMFPAMTNAAYGGSVPIPPRGPFPTGGPGGSDGGVTAAKERLGLENKIGDSLTRNAMFLVKYIALYRIVHDTARLVQNAIEGFFKAGVTYTKELETQSLALRGILAENYKVSLVQDKYVTGLTAVTALQNTAVIQWKLIQQASLSVVGTTADLMQLYTGILPFASKLGADLTKVQELTKSAAVAARLLDVSFSDARSGMVALLQGRALTRNRLVGALGFTKDQIEDLKGTPQLIEAIQARLSDFAELADEAQMTIAAMAESFKDFSGVLAAGFTRPFTDIFKQAIGGLTKADSGFALFSKTAGGLQIRKDVQSFIDFTSAAVKQALGPIKDFGRQVLQTIENDSKNWVLAFRDGAMAATSLAVALTKLTLAGAQWIAQNRYLLQLLGQLAILATVFVAVRKLDAAIMGLATSTAAGSAVMRAFRSVLGMTGGEATATVAKTSLLKTAFTGFSSVLLSLGRGALWGAILYGIERMISGLVRAKQRADALRGALGASDAGGFVTNAQAVLSDPKASDREKRQLVVEANKRLDEVTQQLQSRVGTTPSEIAKKAADYRGELDRLGKVYEDINSEVLKLRGRLVKASAADKANIEKQLNLKMAEGAVAKQNIITKEREQKENQRLQAEQSTLRSVRDGLMKAARESGPLAPSQATVGIRKGLRLTPDLMFPFGNKMAQGLAERFAASDKASLDADLFAELSSPTLTPIIQPPPGDDEGKSNPYALTAPKRVELIKAQLDREVGAVREAVAAMTMTRAQGDMKIQQLSEAASKRAIKIWEEQAEDFWKTKKEGDGTFWDKKNQEAQENMFTQIQEGTQAAILADEELVRNGRIAALERAQAFAHSFEQAEEEIARIEGEIGSRADDVALARYDKRIQAMRKSLTDNFSGTDTERENLRSFDERTGRYRPLVGQKAQAEDRIKEATAQLSVARESQSLLLQSLETGTVSVDQFLARTNELRDRQRQLLLDQISGTRQLIGVYEKSLTLSDLSPDQAASTKTAIAQLKGNVEQAQAALAQLDNQTQRVLAAAQAWDNLTNKVAQFLSTADGLKGFNDGIIDARLGLEKVVSLLGGGLNLINKITQGALAFSQIPQSFKTFTGLFKDAGGFKNSASALGSLLLAPFRAGQSFSGGGGANSGPVQVDFNGTPVAGAVEASKMASNGAKFAAAIPLIGIGISAALAIGTAMFQKAVEKAKNNIKKGFDSVNKEFSQGNINLGEYQAALRKTRESMVRDYSRSKSGRSALRELLPGIDDQIEQAKQQAKAAQKNFEDLFKRIKMGTGVFGDFARDLLDLEVTIKTYLESIDTSTAEGVKQYHEALLKVGEFRDQWFRDAKMKLQENMLGFESEALGAAERFFSLLNEQEGLFRSLRDLDEQRQSLDEQIADEQERREDFQKKQNDLLEREAEIRKQIADVMKRAREEEADIRRRGILEAQLSVAQQKAIEIAGVRTKAQEEIDRLNKELEDLKDQARDDEEDEKKNRERRDRDFERQRRNLAEREEEIRKATRLNEIRLAGAKAVMDLEGSVFGIVKDEFDLAMRQNDLQLRQAEIQVQRWKDTKALIDSIVDTANGVFFDPPDGFPQIHVTLGDITIDNRDQSTVNVNGTGGGEQPEPDDPNAPPGPLPPGDRPDPRRPPRTPDSMMSSFVDYERKFLRR